MGFETFPSKSSPVNPEQQRGQTSKNSPGTCSYPGKSTGQVNTGAQRGQTSKNGPGTRTYAKKGAKQSRPGNDQTPAAKSVPGDITKVGSPNWGDLMAKPSAK